MKEGKESIDKRKFWLIEDEIQVESIQLLKKFTKDDPNFGGYGNKKLINRDNLNNKR